MDNPVLLLPFIVLLFGILNIVLFFKVWGMTNNVKHILNYMLMKDGYEMKEERGAMQFYKKDDDKHSADRLAALEALGRAAANKE